MQDAPIILNPDLITILETVLELVQNSRDSVWSSMDITEIQKELGQHIVEIKAGNMKNIKKLGVLFAPTGPIQEVSIDNGWGERFLELAATFDKLANQ